MIFILKLAVAGLVASIATAESVIVPGAAWTDTAGNIIQAHGAGLLKVSFYFKQYEEISFIIKIIQVGETFYWFGEDKSANSALFSAVSCYTVSVQVKSEPRLSMNIPITVFRHN